MKKQLDNIVKEAIDTNVLIYAYDNSNIEISNIAIRLITPNIIVSNLVIQEFLFQLHKKRKIEKKTAFKLGLDILNIVNLSYADKDTYRYAYYIMNRYDLQLLDSIIIADAILNKCTVLYSRDMQHNFLVDKKMKIINPFL